jgi:putative spermidine/putrescine transport system permease protein
MESRFARVVIKAGSVFVMLFLYVPLLLVFVYAFNDRIGLKWPIDSFTTKYWALAFHNSDLAEALRNSLVIATVATVLALILGSLAAFAVHRFRFFGRNSVSLLLLLPIALPGVLTGIALNASINNFGLNFSLYTIMIGHITFCIVVVFNNVVARLRRTPTSLIEASQDLGAGGWQTFRFVTFPAIRTALIAGALLAFALSFDEIVVTNFTAGAELTIPKFIFDNVKQPRNRPIVNVVAVLVIVVMFIPVYIAQRLAGGGGDGRVGSIRREGPTDPVSGAAAAETAL